jgi:aminomethyltransferase
MSLDNGIVVPAGLGARDTLRLKWHFVYINDDILLPLEAGLGWITKLDKSDFIGGDWMMKQADGLKKNWLALLWMIVVF